MIDPIACRDNCNFSPSRSHQQTAHIHRLCILWVNFQLDFFVSFSTRETKYEDKVEQNREFWAQKSLEFGFTRNLLGSNLKVHKKANVVEEKTFRIYNHNCFEIEPMQFHKCTREGIGGTSRK